MFEGRHEVRHEPLAREEQPHLRAGHIEDVFDGAACALRFYRRLMDEVEEGLLLGHRSFGNVHRVSLAGLSRSEAAEMLA